MADKIREVMTKDLVTCDQSASLQEAAKAMRQNDIGTVIVEKDGKACGIVTDRDLVIRGLADGKTDRRVGELCSQDLFSVKPDDEVREAVRKMREKKVRRVPVLEDGKAVGIVSLGDLAQRLDRESALGEISAAPPTH